MMANFPSLNPQLARQKKLESLFQGANIAGLIVNPGPSLVYLTGLHFHLSERPVVVIIVQGSTPVIILPELELEKLKQVPYDIRPFSYGEDPQTWQGVFQAAAKVAKLEGKPIGVEPRQLRFLEYQLLALAAPQAQFVSAEEVLARLRMYKDDSELTLMRKAVQVAQAALKATLPKVRLSMTEQELASELTLQLLNAGCDPEMPFSPIVSSGPNSANPHATPSTRKLQLGNLLVIDWGASHLGYISDITRTFAIGEIDPEFTKISKIVAEANQAGRDAAKPGIAMEVVDQAARGVIETAGYGQYFTHRTGHGLGMEAHEMPYIRAGNQQLLEPGMTFTIEPGIYLPGRNGVRIEDDVAITSTGIECLTDLPRDLRRLI